MPTLNIARTRDLLQQFDFKALFVEELNWSQPASRKPGNWQYEGHGYEYRHIAELGGVVVLEVTGDEGTIPPAKTRAAIHKGISSHFRENLLIFVDKHKDPTQSLWYWVKQEAGKLFPREHLYMRGQPGDLFISKLSGMVFDISQFDEFGNVSLIAVSDRLRNALDIERVTKKFYLNYAAERLAFTDLINGIPDERQRRWYASVLLNRLMFIYFLQSKLQIAAPPDRYLQDKLQQTQIDFGADQYYAKFLKLLFFEGFAKPEQARSDEAKRQIGSIPYLNGGLFLEHKIEEEYRDQITIPDQAFANLFGLFEGYSWNLNDTPGGKDDEINPDVLGYIFEKYINQKEFGAYYTRPEITEYLCEHTIHQLILDKINPSADIPGLPPGKRYATLPDLLLDLDATNCRRLLYDILPNLSLLDPACGSGAFLVAAMKTLINIYSAVTGRIDYLSDLSLKNWITETRRDHRSLNYHIKRKIITENLYGVDIMEEGCDIARLRLFLALVSSVQKTDELEPLPNIDFNILPGNSLIGLLHVKEEEFDGRLQFTRPYHELIAEKNRLIHDYRHAATYTKELQSMRDNIRSKMDEAGAALNELLLNEFINLGIRFEQATWDVAKGREGKPQKRPLTLADIAALNPFHWGYTFDEIVNKRGGFDAIITNPPWEVFQATNKEFLSEHLEGITKNSMSIKDFQQKQADLLRDNKLIRAEWEAYHSRFPHVSAYLKSAPQFKSQISIVNGKNVGSKINLYSYFLEQCYNLLRENGQCGIVVPSGIYTDLGAKQLRELLFSSTKITGLFGFENRKIIFENVDSRFKFVVLTFCKAGKTNVFPAAFMRQDVKELAEFPRHRALNISVELIRRLSPESIALLEYKSELDICIAEKMLRYPTLGERLDKTWNLVLSQEINMTSDSHLFVTEPIASTVPLVQGGMFHQFQHDFAPPKYWMRLTDGRNAVLGRQQDTGQTLPYQEYRLAHRRIARNTDNRTMIACVLPRNRFCADTAQTVKQMLPNEVTVFIVAILNSFVFDSELRRRVTTHCDMHFVYALRVPRLTSRDPAFQPIAHRAARLICTTPEFDDLARAVGLKDHTEGATDMFERAQLRAELDGLIAHLYGLTESEYIHILSTFPLVAEPIKIAAQNAYRDVARGVVK